MNSKKREKMKQNFNQDLSWINRRCYNIKLISPVFIAVFMVSLSVLMVSSFALAGTPHGINGYVDNCGGEFEVNGANVTLQLADSGGIPLPCDNLTAVVEADGWYYSDAGNFADPWEKGYIVFIVISKDGYVSSTSVILTEAGNDQAFAVCLGPGSEEEDGSGAYRCACGNGLCEWWAPHCENVEFDVKTLLGISITTKRCPEDCEDCICGDGFCDYAGCGENAKTCPEDCPAGYCGDGICQTWREENQDTCPEDCGYADTAAPNCGNGDCEPELGETWQTCPIDCYVASAMCGDKKCAGAETSDNCCQDCGCPKGEKGHVIKCLPEYKLRGFKKVQTGPYKCRETCCLAGYCNVWFGTCWYTWVSGIIGIIIAVMIYILTMPSLGKIALSLVKIRRLKDVILAAKISS